MNKFIISPAEFSQNGSPVSWKIKLEGTPPKAKRANARKKIKSIFGTCFFYSNPPSQNEVDLKLNKSETLEV